MERKGPGKPATRAGIVEKLVKCGFVKREKPAGGGADRLVPTRDGTEGKFARKQQVLGSCPNCGGQVTDLLSVRIKQLEGRLAEVSEMRGHIINYARTREIYQGYGKARNKREYRAEHEKAKRDFDALGGKKVPKMAELAREYEKLLSEKRECYEAYKEAREEMVAFRNACQNVDRILGILPEKETGKKRER